MSALWQLLMPYVLLAVGFGLCLFLFVTLKVEIGGLRRREREDQKQIQELVNIGSEARSELARLKTGLGEVQGQIGILVPPAPARSGLNLTKRTQVLRMHRAGQESAGIAVALGLPRAEVDLLIKVQRLVLEKVS